MIDDGIEKTVQTMKVGAGQEDCRSLGYAARQEKLDDFYVFLGRIHVNDLVVSVSQQKVYFGTVPGDASFTKSGDGHSNLRRSVQWTPIPCRGLARWSAVGGSASQRPAPARRQPGSGRAAARAEGRAAATEHWMWPPPTAWMPSADAGRPRSRGLRSTVTMPAPLTLTKVQPAELVALTAAEYEALRQLALIDVMPTREAGWYEVAAGCKIGTGTVGDRQVVVRPKITDLNRLIFLLGYC